MAAILQGLLAVLSVLSLRIPILAITRALEVIDDPTIVTKQSDLAPSFVSKFLIANGVVYGVIGVVLALTAATICFLALRRQQYRLCRRASIIQCLCFPIGTASGALTLVLLSQTAIQAKFDGLSAGQADESAS